MSRAFKKLRRLRAQANIAISFSEAAVAVAGRRLRGQPLHPTWSAAYELAVTWLKGRYDRQKMTLERLRRLIDQAGPVELRRGRVRWEEVHIGAMRAEWALPKEALPKEEGEELGAILYLHGGGYMMGSVSSHRSLLAAITCASDLPILAIEYRLAPEHPCPAAIEDAVSAYRYLIEERGFAPASVVIAGDSAGGGLTLTTLLSLRDQGLPLPAAGICISPWTDLSMSGSTLEENSSTDFLPLSELPATADHYRGELPIDDPRVSPLFADLRGLPPLLVQVGDAEILYADGVRLAEKARAAGVEVALDIGPGQVHVWHLFERVNPESAAAIRRLAAFARVALRRARRSREAA